MNRKMHRPGASRGMAANAYAASPLSETREREAHGSGMPLGAAGVLQLQRLYGNRMTVQLLKSSGQVVQMGNCVGGESKDAKPNYEEQFIGELMAAEDGPAKYAELLKTYEGKGKAIQALMEADSLLQSEVDDFRNKEHVFSGKTPLNETEAFAIIRRIEQGDLSVRQELVNVKGELNEKDPRSHEWGIAKAKTSKGEVLLLRGEHDNVDWSGTGNVLTPLGHSHPYFPNSKGTTRDHRGKVQLDTKVIADHQETGKGAIAWASLAAKKTADASNEVSKIFPSGSDIEFSAKRKLSKHVVYTPYAVVADDTHGLIVTNPGSTNRDARRLRFEIIGAETAGENEYKCSLTAYAEADMIWQADVTATGGQFGMLKW